MSEHETLREAKEDRDYQQVFTNCNSCGRKLHYVYEDECGLCEGCITGEQD